LSYPWGKGKRKYSKNWDRRRYITMGKEHLLRKGEITARLGKVSPSFIIGPEEAEGEIGGSFYGG